jgi:hypothetical protein
VSTPAAFNRFCSPSLSPATATTVTPGYEPDWDCRLRRSGREALGAGSRPALIALAIQHEYPKDAVVRLADFYKGSNLVVGTKRRIEGLTLRATDADWPHGSGPEVSGPIMPLVMAMTGRKDALDNLTGDGVSTLRTRA